MVADRNHFVANTSGTRGGALYLNGPVTAVATANQFCDNSGTDGGAVFASGGAQSWTGNLFQDNAATQKGGGLYTSGALTLAQNTFVGNAGFLGGGAMYLTGTTSTTGTATNNLIGWSQAGDGVQGDTNVAWSYNDWYLNLGANVGGGLTTAEAYGPGTLQVNPQLATWTMDNNCNDVVVPIAASPIRNVGAPGTTDPDGSAADLGWTGGATSALRDLDQDGDPSWLDCDDGDASVGPGAAEVPYDGVDQDCSGTDDFDADDDGERAPWDCDDQDPALGAADDADGDGVCDAIDLCAGDDAGGNADGDGVCDAEDLCDGDDASGETNNDVCGRRGSVPKDSPPTTCPTASIGTPTGWVTTAIGAPRTGTGAGLTPTAT